MRSAGREGGKIFPKLKWLSWIGELSECKKSKRVWLALKDH